MDADQNIWPVRLKDELEHWTFPNQGPGGRGCQWEEGAYCLPNFSGKAEAVGGVLGKWGVMLTKLKTSHQWAELTREEHQVVKELLGGGSSGVEWRGLLSCIISKALEIKQIKVRAGGNWLQLWSNQNWAEALNKGVVSPWNQNTTGQAMFLAVTCVIRALIGYQVGGRNQQKNSQALCGEVWNTVKINLPKTTKEIQGIHVKSLEQFLSLVGPNSQDPLSPYGSIGLLLTIYYGLITCGNHKPPYDLTGLINTNGWDLEKLGSCTLNKSIFSCGGGTGETDQPRINIWNKTMAKVVSEDSDEESGLSKLTLVTEDTEDQVAKRKAEQQRRNNETAEKIAGGMNAAHNQAKETQTVYGPNSNSLSVHLREPRHSRSLPPATQGSTLQSQHSRVRSTTEATKVPIPVGGHDETTEEQEPSQTGPSEPQEEKLLSFRGPSSEEFEVSKGQAGDEKEQTLNVEGKTPSAYPTPSLNPSKSTEGIGGILGGIMGILLALGGIYGLYRVYFRKPKPFKDRRQQTQATTRNVTYGQIEVD
ncbi:hypothetical protein C922_05682 [Plasmodium inui San Antonio 1]|uniref:Uncharacterized protein n=1 Tax=Plasmodium inui San Antonio 1 TaxID=1237626 RepID=W6ZXA2_9APIC|nr:hypothetical protein C922_05682 [Plasmodium inui San Antonio 1]EUD63938.1 hypothetical protein C922_05682 [Plasmodium inui San Antonio 1]